MCRASETVRPCVQPIVKSGLIGARARAYSCTSPQTEAQVPPCRQRKPSRKIAGVVWRPDSLQWRLIWILAAIIVLFWPSQQSRSLAIKALNWAADPTNALPRMPGQFSMEDGEDPVAVSAHDDQEAEYNRVYASSRLARLRIRLRDTPDPFEPSTQQQVLAAIGVLGGLLIWRFGARPARD